MRITDAVAVDFETEAIDRRPHYPPRPVGVAIADGRRSEYLAWGHPTGNNCTPEKARARLTSLWTSGQPLVFFNGKFDLDVAETHLQLKYASWDRYHDALYLAFLDDPLARDLRLGTVAPRYLRVKAWKAGALEEWIVQHVAEARRGKKDDWAAHISKAPGHLAAVRASGDAANTLRLFHKLHAKIMKRGMGVAYDRERRLLYPLLKAERGGIRVAAARLRRDLDEFYLPFLEQVDEWLRRALKAPDLDLDKGRQLFTALEDAGAITEPILTEKGNPSVGKLALEQCIDDPKLLAILRLRGPLATAIRTFMRPWLAQASETGGFVHTQWNQTRQPEGGGARTGRLSSTPNFQNLLNPDRVGAVIDPVEKFWRSRITAFRASRRTAVARLPLVPALRDYILPDSKDHVLLVRDYSQQEMRILAHFEDGTLKQRYQADPTLDVHDAAQALIKQMTGVWFDRRPVKDTGFGLVYGLGVAGLAAKIGQPYQVAQQLRNAYLRSMPGIGVLMRDMKVRAAADQPIRTWGGREYYCEPPAIVKGRIRQFDYKLINVLIQGSAADNTKEAICRYDEAGPERYGARFLLTVHDESVASAPKENLKPAMAQLRRSMESVEFDVLMLSDGKTGPTWAKLAKYKDNRTED